MEADNTQSSSTDDIVITEDGVFLSCFKDKSLKKTKMHYALT